MKTSDNGHSGNERAQKATGPPSAMKPGRLLEAARCYFSEDFGNPSREGCPSPGSFEAILRQGDFPPEELRRHLFGCSECFREYHGSLAARRTVDVARKPAPWPGRLWRPRLVPAYALLGVIVLSLATAFIMSRGRSDVGENIANVGSTPPPAASSTPDLMQVDNPNALEAAAPSPAPQPRTDGTSLRSRGRRRPAAALSSILVDLAGYSVLRDDEATPAVGGGTTLLPAVNRLRILLPEGSPHGLYSVTVVGAFDEPLTVRRAARSFGKYVEVTIDTRGLAGRRCRLRIARDGDVPDYYPITVSRR